ncbi:MAG: DUF3192 domain-containing protein [Proteobacteria bacterium]|nr:DUF3192 domain-containing protein [Pseudomonadota bacterium]
MIKNSQICLFVIFMIVGLCGCPFYWNHDTKTLAWDPQSEPLLSDIEDVRNLYNLKCLEKGMERDEVYSIMGMPDLYGQFQSRDEDDMDVFFYYTRTAVDDGSATVEECTPLVLKNGKLEGWGNEDYARFSGAGNP